MPQPTRCTCADLGASSGCAACDGAPVATRMRLLRCACGTRRPGDAPTCPACGEAGGDEILVRSSGRGTPSWMAPVSEVVTIRPAPTVSLCGLCRTPMDLVSPWSDLRRCQVCDEPVARLRP